jgi:hypothetical protein
VNDKLRDLLDAEGQRRFTEEGMKADMEERSSIMEELIAADPQLSVMGAMVMAGDRQSRLRMQSFVEQGINAKECGTFVGSYERLAFWRWAYEQGHITRSELNDYVVSDWSSSDPDDSDPFWVECWQDIYDRNGGPVFDEPAPKMKMSRLIKVYRGQPEGAVPGIAWSMDINVARKFAKTGGARATNRTDGVIYEAFVKVSDCYAFLWGRNEQEVVLNPARLLTHEGQDF